MSAAFAICLLLAAPGSETVDQARAKRLFDAGLSAINSSDFAQARTQLRQSLELFPALPTAYNLAIAERSLGDYLTASSLLQEILAGTYGELRGKERQTASRWLRDNEAKIAELVILCEEPVLEIRIDDRPVAGTRHRLNPGRVQVAVSTALGRFEQRLSLAPGEARELVIDFAAIETPTASETERPGVIEEPNPIIKAESGATWWWLGAAAVAVAAGITTFVLVRGDSDSDAPMDTSPAFPRVETLTVE